uniref:Uncharacterized protein n=1 Tax=Rhizophora mucronata TaxID=61149 RepID=A0A2P2KXN2_RHIMU
MMWQVDRKRQSNPHPIKNIYKSDYIAHSAINYGACVVKKDL